MTQRDSFLRRRVLLPTLSFLKQGVTPQKLAQCFAIGLVVACFPVLGSTTLLCTAIALPLRLNLPAIQLANWVAYPLQLAVLIPLFRAGEWLFGVAVQLPLTPEKLVAMFRADFWGSIAALWDTTLHAIAAWALMGIPLMILLYFVLLPIFRRLSLSRSATT